MNRLSVIKNYKKDNKMFNFKNLISKYSKGTVTATIEKGGYYDVNQGGKWIVDNETIELFPFAIVPLSQDDLKFNEGGTYNEDNRKLYCYERLDKKTKILNVMEDGTKRSYTILSDKDYSDYDNGLHIYILKRGDRDAEED